MPRLKKATDPDVLNARDVAALLGLEEHTVYDGAIRGDIPSRRIGRRVLFSRRALQAWMHGEEPLSASENT